MKSIYPAFVKQFNNNAMRFEKEERDCYEIHVIITSDNFDLKYQLDKTNDLFQKHGDKFGYYRFMSIEHRSLK